MTAEFNVWLLIVGLVVGAGLVWLVIMDSRRRETEVDEVERPREAAWLSSVMADDGFDISPEAVERLLLLHRAYLEAAPPDGAFDGPEAPVEIDTVDHADGAVATQSTDVSDATEPPMRPSPRAGSEKADRLPRSS